MKIERTGVFATRDTIITTSKGQHIVLPSLAPQESMYFDEQRYIPEVDPIQLPKDSGKKHDYLPALVFLGGIAALFFARKQIASRFK